MIFRYDNREKVFETDKAVGFKIAETSTKEFVELHLKPQGVVPSHSLPINVTFYVKEGSGEVIVNNETIQAQLGDVLEVKPRENREWRNISQEDLILLVVKDLK